MSNKKKNNIAWDKFARHYAEFGIATQAYLHAYPNVTYGTAGTNGSKLLENTEIQEKIKLAKEELAVAAMRSRERTIADLLQSAEEAKEAGQFNAYGKLHDMVIRLLGFYDIDNAQKGNQLPTEIKVNIVKKNKEDNGNPSN